MKYTFETDDSDEAKMIINAREAFDILFKIKHILRKYNKYEEMNDSQSELFGKLKAEIDEYLYEIEID